MIWRYKVTINPDITALRMNSTALVEHHIDATGRKFRKEKLDKVTGFLFTTTIKQLSSLLELANYFKASTKLLSYCKTSPAIFDWVREEKPIP